MATAATKTTNDAVGTNWITVLMAGVGASVLRAESPEFVPKKLRKLNPAAAEFLPAALAGARADQQAVKELMTIMTSPFVEEKSLVAHGQDLYKTADGRTIVLASSLDNHSALMDGQGFWAIPEAGPVILSAYTIRLFEEFREREAKNGYTPKSTDPDLIGRYCPLSEDEIELGTAFFGRW